MISNINEVKSQHNVHRVRSKYWYLARAGKASKQASRDTQGDPRFNFSHHTS